MWKRQEPPFGRCQVNENIFPWSLYSLKFHRAVHWEVMQSSRFRKLSLYVKENYDLNHWTFLDCGILATVRIVVAERRTPPAIRETWATITYAHSYVDAFLFVKEKDPWGGEGRQGIICILICILKHSSSIRGGPVK